MWRVGADPVLRSDFATVAVVERPPTRAAMKRYMDRAVEALPRLRHSVAMPLFGQQPRWHYDGAFDAGKHLSWVTLQRPGDVRQLLDLTAKLMAVPLPGDRPPWAFVVVRRLQEGRAAIVHRFHHSLLDGWQAMKLARTLFDDDRPPASSVRTPPDSEKTVERSGAQAGRFLSGKGGNGPLHQFAQLGNSAVRLDLGDLLSWSRRIAAAPEELVRTAQSAASQLLTGGSRSPLLDRRSSHRRMETYSLPRQAVQTAARSLGGDINVVFLAGLAAALGSYHALMGAPCPQLRVGLPVGVHQGQHDLGGNQFSPLRLLVPTHADAPRSVRVIRELLKNVKAAPAVALAGPLTEIINLLPDAILIPVVRSQAGAVDAIASFLPGPRGRHHAAGVPIVATYPFGPLFGVSLDVTAITFGDWLHLGVHLDPEAVDAALLMKCLHDSYQALVDAGAVGPRL